ncbi:reverse transcriptase domain-containing protein [Tanacetum coccineum]
MSSRGLVYLETYILFIDKYGYIKNHKKTVKNEQARTREPEEYKAEARKAKPQSKSAKKSQSQSKMVKQSQHKRTNPQNVSLWSLNSHKSPKMSPPLIGPHPDLKSPLNLAFSFYNKPQGPILQFSKVIYNLKKGIEREGLKVQICQSPITRMTLELANRSITHPMGIAEDVVVKVDGFTFLADFVVVSFEPDPRVPIILGRPFLGTAKALIDLYEEKLTLRVGKDELVYYADKSEKNKEKNCVHAISIIDFSKDNPFSGNTTNTLPPSSSPMKTSDNFEKFSDELAPLDSLPPGNDDSTFKKDFHEVNFQVYSNTLFEFDDNFKSSNVNPLFEEHDKDVEIKSSSSFTLTSPEVSELEAYLEKDSIPPGIDLTLPPTFKVSSSNPTSPTLTGEKDSTYLHKKPKPPQEVQKVEMKDNEVSSEIPIDVIVMPIRITFDNPIDFNDHFSKPKDLKKDLTISFDSTTTSILPHPLLDSDSPFTAELSASGTLNSFKNEDKVFKPGILVYHAIHDKNLVILEENLKENISSGTLLVFKKPSFVPPPPEPPDECLKNVVLNFYQNQKTFPLNVEDVNSFTFIIWTFLPHFTYSKESPLIFSFRSENFVFDPGIITFHNPVAVSMKVSICSP